jgi:fructose-1,6-bisphosphatase I
MKERNKTLGEFIENQNAFQYSSGELSRIINSIRLAAKVVNYKVKAGLVDIVGAGEQNIQGKISRKLDVYAKKFYSNIDKSRNCMRNSF